ncbi:AAA family ATPase [archaeon]|nr:AAA family ATPase [archaeon]
MNKNKKQLWFKKYGWDTNPFTLEIKPTLLVGYSKEIQILLNNLDEQQKHILLTGPTGAGKTTLLKWISSKYNTLYLPKPPKKEEDLVLIFNERVLNKTFFERIKNTILKDKTTIYNLAEKTNKKMKGRPFVVLVDEAHETKTEILEWLRSIIDQIEGTSIVFAGLHTIKETHMNKLETLSQRIVADIELTTLSKDETVQLIKKRIESVGGKSIEPFTMDAINEIYKRTGGFPREVLKGCNNLLLKAKEKDAEIIDSTYFDKEPKKETIEDIKINLNVLTEKQRSIMDLIKKHNNLTPAQIVDLIDYKVDYKTKAHALRAINNILRRLETANMVLRERKGRAYTYILTPKIKSIFVEA